MLEDGLSLIHQLVGAHGHGRGFHGAAKSLLQPRLAFPWENSNFWLRKYTVHGWRSGRGTGGTAKNSLPNQSSRLFHDGLWWRHEVAWPHHAGLADALPEERIGIINFDARFDLRKPENGPSSGTPFYQIAEYNIAAGKPFDYFCIGIQQQSNTKALTGHINSACSTSPPWKLGKIQWKKICSNSWDL